MPSYTQYTPLPRPCGRCSRTMEKRSNESISNWQKRKFFILAAAVLCPSAFAFTREPEYSARLPRSMPVFCTWSQAEWNKDPNGGSGVDGYTYISGPHDGDIHLSPNVCVGLQ